jgi:cell division ATPase FtsA
MGRLQNAAYECYIREDGIANSEKYSKFDNVLHYMDKLGRDLFTDIPFGGPTPHERSESVKRNIGSAISSLLDLANQQNVTVEDTLAEALEKYRSLKEVQP